MHADGLIGTAARERIKECARSRRFGEADEVLIDGIKKAASERKDAEAAREVEQRKARLDGYLKERQTERLRWKFEWSDDQLQEYAELRLEMDGTHARMACLAQRGAGRHKRTARHERTCARTHAYMYAYTDARPHARTHARTHALEQAQLGWMTASHGSCSS